MGIMRVGDVWHIMGRGGKLGWFVGRWRRPRNEMASYQDEKK